MSSEPIPTTPDPDLLGEVVAIQDPKERATWSKMRAALEAAKLDPDMATELAPKSAFSRARAGLKENRAIDSVKRDGDIITFQLTKKENTGDEIEYAYEAKITLDCTSGEIRCDESGALQQQARDLFDVALQERTANDITRLVQSMFKSHADLFPIVPSKGVAYFVPEKFKPFTAQVDAFLDALGGKLCRFPVPKGTVVANSNVRDAVSTGLDTLVTELNTAVESWDDSTRHDTMERAVAKWQTIAYKAEAYGEYLGEQQAAILERLKEAKSALAAKISAKMEAKDAPAETIPEETPKPVLVHPMRNVILYEAYVNKCLACDQTPLSCNDWSEAQAEMKAESAVS